MDLGSVNGDKGWTIITLEKVFTNIMEKDIVLNNALVNAKEGLEKVPSVATVNVELFDDLLLVGNVVQWPAMLLGHTKHDKNEDVIQLYPQMFE